MNPSHGLTTPIDLLRPLLTIDGPIGYDWASQKSIYEEGVVDLHCGTWGGDTETRVNTPNAQWFDQTDTDS